MRIVTVLVHLPTLYNPDKTGNRRPIDDERFMLTSEELAQKFGGGTLWRFPQGIAPTGFWWSRGILSTDALAILEVDIPDTREARTWIKKYAQEALIERFEQDAIYLKFYGADSAAEAMTVTKKRSDSS